MSGADLNLLLSLKSRGQLEKCLRLCLVPDGDIAHEVVVKAVGRTLGLEDTSAEQADQVEGIVRALRACVRGIVSKGAERYFEELGGDGVNPKLKSLLIDIAGSKMNEWKDASLMGLSLPRLLHHDWTMHKQSASSAVQQMNVPVVLVRLKVEGTPTDIGVIPPAQEVDFELSREALETMLDGMSKIKDQLTKTIKR